MVHPCVPKGGAPVHTASSPNAATNSKQTTESLTLTWINRQKKWPQPRVVGAKTGYSNAARPFPPPWSVHLTDLLSRKPHAHSRYRQMPCERAESSAPDAASQSGSPRTVFVHPTPQGVAALSHRILHQLSWNRPSLHILVWRGFLFLDRRGVIKPCGYLLQATSFEIFHSGKMIWGEVGALFSLACFGALVLFMVRREPEA